MAGDEGDDAEEDEDEESMDAEAITAFALSPNNTDLIAVTRSHLVRKCNRAVPSNSFDCKLVGYLLLDASLTTFS